MDDQAEIDGSNYDRGFRDATARFLRERVATLGKKLENMYQECQKVEGELDAAKQELDNVRF